MKSPILITICCILTYFSLAAQDIGTQEEVNSDNTVTVSFNCGEGAKNSIHTKGQDFTITVGYYGVTEPVIEANNKDAVPNPYTPLHMVTEATK